MNFDKIGFEKISTCVEDLAQKYSYSVSVVLRLLDRNHKGIREWYNRNGEELYFKKEREYPSSSKKSKNFVERLITSPSLLLTGAVPGEFLVGVRTQSNNTIMKLSGGNNVVVPPSKKFLDSVRSYEDVWKVFIQRLSSIPHFSKMTFFEREVWLHRHQTTKDPYLEDIPNLRVEVVQLGTGNDNFFLKLPFDKIDNIFDSEEMPIQKLYNIFPKNPSSEGLKGKHTLLFRRGLWKVSITHKESKSFEGVLVDILEGEVLDGGETSPSTHETILIFDNFAKEYGLRGKINESQSVGFLTDSSSKPLRKNTLLKEFLNGVDLEKSIECLGIGALKSLMQKIIRFRPVQVELENGKLLDSKDAFIQTFLLLVLKSGTFVPDIQRYVTGVESGLKRIIVSLFEDGYVHEENESKALSIMASAFLAQRAKGWNVSTKVLKWCIELGVRSIEESKGYDINTSYKGKLPTLSPNENIIGCICAILKEVKSFHGDIALIANLSKASSPPTQSNKLRPNIMPLIHCVDQHWAPEIVYMYDENLVSSLVDKGSKPFSTLFKRIFGEVTGVNPRRRPRKGTTFSIQSYSKDFEEREFVMNTRKAQRLTLSAKISKGITHKKTKGFYKLHSEIDYSWITGMMGSVEIKLPKVPKALVTMRFDESCQFTVVRKPTRNMKTPILSDEQESLVMDFFLKALKKNGVLLNQCKPPVPEMKNSRMFMKNGEIHILLKGENTLRDWNEFRREYSVKIPYIEKAPSRPEEFYKYTCSEGIVRNHEEPLKKLVKRTDFATISRALIYLSTYDSTIEFPKIGREGGGSEKHVLLEDVKAHKFVMELSQLYPSAISRRSKSILKFNVKCAPLLWHVSNTIRSYITKKVECDVWDNIGVDRSNRTLRNHQKDAIREMKETRENGIRGHFIWIPVGLGKTLIVLSYIAWLNEQNLLPKYVLYTLPSSAMESVIQEIEMMSFEYSIIVPNKNLTAKQKSNSKIQRSCDLQKHKINIIEHDSLRKCSSDIVPYMNECIFIIDEVHKCFNFTQRTEHAIQLSYVSKEFIALTGTPIIDNKTHKLVRWLKQLVRFEVNERNFWTAANSMISKKVSTGVNVVRKEIPVKIPSKIFERYKNYVSESLGGVNTNPGPSDFQKAMEICYELTDKKMVELTRKYITEGKGVFLVARNQKHQEKLSSMINDSINSSDAFLMKKGSSIFLTDDSVKNGGKDYKVVITTLRMSEGYTLTRLKVMITSVYPSNNATRTQLEGRINRLSSKPGSTVYYNTVHCGILSHILQYHNDAKNLQEVLRSLADDIVL